MLKPGGFLLENVPLFKAKPTYMALRSETLWRHPRDIHLLKHKKLWSLTAYEAGKKIANTPGLDIGDFVAAPKRYPSIER
jgi:hypothetical protein